MNFAGYELELGDWAQASGAVDLSEGAVSANIGGEDGLGIDASIAEGNLDLNLFGHEVDVDEAISDGVDWVASTAGDVWDGATSIAGDVWDGATSVAGDVWDGATSLAGGAISAVGSFFSGW